MVTNKRHILFIEAYCANGQNATDAYAQVYPKCAYNTAKTNGNKLLTNADIMVEINSKLSVVAQKFHITKEDVARHVADIMYDQKKQFPPSSLKAAEIINKMFGYNEADKQSVNHDQNITIIESIEVQASDVEPPRLDEGNEANV